MQYKTIECTCTSTSHALLSTVVCIPPQSAGSVGCAGNMLLDRMSGAHIVTLTPDLTEGRSLQSLIEEYAARLRYMYAVSLYIHNMYSSYMYIVYSTTLMLIYKCTLVT